MPSTRKYTDRKRPRPSDCDEDSQPTKQKNGKPHFRIDQLLKAYRDKQLNEDSDKVLKYVPESVKSVFVPYIKHVQTINNNLYSIKSLFDSNAKSLKLELTDKFEEVAKNTQNKLNKISDDLISELISNFDQDPVYESMKAACVKPIVSLDKLEEPACSREVSLIKNSTTAKKEDAYDVTTDAFRNENVDRFENSTSKNFTTEKTDAYDDFIDSDIDLQIIEACDNITRKYESKEIPNSKTVESKDKDTCIKKRVLPDLNQNDLLKNLSYDSDGYLLIYTDGCCLANGKNEAQAGIGVWFNHDHPLNVALPVKGPATNNNAEIQAATAAILIASNLKQKKVRICTDSQFLINCMTAWIHKWKKNNWRTADKNPVKNRESLEELDNILSSLDAVDWRYVPGHKGIVGNECADVLAKNGAQLYAKNK